jgi:hypothetical protein
MSGSSAPVRVGGGSEGADARGPVGIVACGALALHVRAIVRRRGFDVVVETLPPLHHNRPALIVRDVRRALRRLSRRCPRLGVAYADCGTGGALDEVLAEFGARRLPGSHCYEVLGGPEVERALDEEPGTYFLTDFLARTFERTVVRPLGLDRHPELRDEYFRHYRRVVYLAQAPAPELLAAARQAAARLGLPLEVRTTGEGGLERALEDLVGEPGADATRDALAS